MTQSGEQFDPYYHWLGIPPDEQPPNHYRLLGIKLFEENRSVIQNAADRQMAHLRTFQAGPHGADSQKLLNQVSAARVCLLSADKKAAYDAELKATAAVAVPPPPTVAPQALEAAAGDAEGVSAAGGGVPVVKTAGSAAANRRGAARRKSRASWGLLSTGLALIIFAGVAVFWGLYPPATPAPNRLVLNWPAAERSAATLKIDGHEVDLAKAVQITEESIELEVVPGPHEYCISHPRSEPLTGRFVLPDGGRVKIDVDLNLAQTIDPAENRELVLYWPESERKNRVLHIDGAPYELSGSKVERAGDQLRVMLLPGPHTITLTQNGEKRLMRQVNVGPKSPGDVSLSSGVQVGALELTWSTENRVGFTLLLDGEPLHPDDAKISEADRDVLRYQVPAGRSKLELQQDSETVLSRQLHVVPQDTLSVHVDAWIHRIASRILLRWPMDQRSGARLEIDGKQRDDLATGATADAETVLIDVQPGHHTIRITRPDHATFETRVTVAAGTRSVDVDLKPLVSTTIDDQRHQELREDYVAEYTDYVEYHRWNQEENKTQKKKALAELLSGMLSEAAKMERGSERQYVAYEEMYRLAVDQMALVKAYAILEQLTTCDCIGEQERQRRGRELWDRAVAQADLETTLAFFDQAETVEKQLNDEQMRALGRRISQSIDPAENYRAWEKTISAFQDRELISDAIADQVRARLLLGKAGRASRLQPVPLVGLGERMIKLVPELLEEETSEALETARELIDAAEQCQRAIMRNRRAALSLRRRLRGLDEAIEARRTLIDRHRRILDAKQSIAAGRGTSTDHRLWGLWLLQKSQYEEALPFLRKSGDPSLAAIAEPVPESDRERSDLVSAIESEAKKTKYPKPQQSALKAYAKYVQRLN